MRIQLLAVTVCLSIPITIACSTSPESTGSSTSASTEEERLARDALKVIGANVSGSSKRCAGCHAVTGAQLTAWAAAMTSTQTACLDSTLTLTPLERVSCLRSDPAVPDSEFDPSKLGLLAASAHLPAFENLFKSAYSATEWPTQYATFKAAAGMPRGTTRPKMTQVQFDKVKEWVTRGLPKLAETLVEGPGPTTCVQSIPQNLIDYVNRMKNEGWAAKNRDNGMIMFACDSGATTPLDCFKQKNAASEDVFPLASTKTYAQTWAHGAIAGNTVRILKELPYRTAYWTRSSADGRFVAHGKRGGGGSAIADLQSALTGSTRTEIAASASWDPGFFPDNSGFAFNDTIPNEEAAFCHTSLLTNPATTRVTFNEPECASTSSIPVYQIVGASLDGSDYFVTTGPHENDDGGKRLASRDPKARYGSSASITVTPVISSGTAYDFKTGIVKPTPFEGDVILSPSSQLVITRVGNTNQQLGYSLRLLTATKTATGYDIDLPQTARLCLNGAKANVSFDERFIATHHYADETDFADYGFASATDPGFVALLAKGTSNVYIVDLLTGQKSRITDVAPGQYALYPHFRSDGWLYFLVRDAVTLKEYVAASDAAVRLP